MAGARKQARSPKRGSTGAVPTVTPGTTGDYVDYTRIPFDLNSPENKIRTKKMSVSGTTVGTRKESVTAQLPVVAAEAEDWEADAKESGAAASADGLDGVNLQAYMSQMTTHTRSNNQDVDLGTGQGARNFNEGAPAPRPTSSTNRVPFPRITQPDMNDSRPPSTPSTSHAPSRHNVRTPTLGEHAHRLQQTTPLPPPQPNYIAEQQYKAVEAAVNDSKGTAAVISSAGLKHLLQRNIEASAMAVYQLQDQQQPQRQLGSSQSQRRPRTRDAETTIAGLGTAGLTGVTAASQPTAAHPPARLRPSLGNKARTARQQPSPQNKHKPEHVDWSNHPLLSSGETLAPTVMSASTNLPAGTGAVTSATPGPAGHTWAGGSTQMQTDSPARGHLPQQGNLDLQAMFPSAKSSSAYDDRAAVVRQHSPAHTDSASAVSKSTEQNPFSDMVVAGRKRNIETNREKVTNATLFM
jgi:hypothetical protein